jgi:PAT family beta-lactamase induction signal transducer AmpG
MMVPGMISGWLQQAIGYRHFFLAVCVLTVPGILVIFKLPVKDESPA